MLRPADSRSILQVRQYSMPEQPRQDDSPFNGLLYHVFSVMQAPCGAGPHVPATHTRYQQSAKGLSWHRSSAQHISNHRPSLLALNRLQLLAPWPRPPFPVVVLA